MDRQQQEGFLVTTEQDIVKLQQDVERLEREIKLYRDPFSRPEQLKLEQGATGAARFKKLLLDIFWNSNADEQQALDAHGSWSNMLHWDLESTGTTTRWCRPALMPSDCVVGGISSSINWLWATSAIGNLELNITVEGFNKDSLLVGATNFLDSTPVTIASPSAIDTLTLVSIDLTTRPKADDLISCKFERIADDGNDTCSGTGNIYAIWIEYLAFI